MPTATQHNTTPTRRAAMRISATALFAGLAAPALGRQVAIMDADRLLADLVKRMDEQWAVTELIAADMNAQPEGRSPQSDENERRMEVALDDWWATLDRIRGTPASSASGLVSKAYAMRHMIEHTALTELARPQEQQLADADLDTQLAWSLASDLLACGAAL